MLFDRLRKELVLGIGIVSSLLTTRGRQQQCTTAVNETLKQIS